MGVLSATLALPQYLITAMFVGAETVSTRDAFIVQALLDPDQDVTLTLQLDGGRFRLSRTGWLR
eukprot:5545639-Prorocentrum_lima.AAC.1